MKPSTTLSALYLLHLSSAQDAPSTGNCTQFTWNTQKAYISPYSTPIRVSGAISCPQSSANTTCALTARGDEQFLWSTNITNLASDVPGTTNNVFLSAVAAAVGNDTSFSPYPRRSVIAVIDQTRALEAGQSGYLNFTGLRYCYEGATEGCTGAVENGAPVEVCLPLWHDDRAGGFPLMSGEYEVVEVEEGEVGNLRNPYENQSRGDSGGEGAAASLGVSYGLLAAAVAGAVVLV